MRWEYKILNFSKRSFFTGEIDTQELAKMLNELGQDGWEVTSCTQNRMQKILVVLKRPMNG